MLLPGYDEYLLRIIKLQRLIDKKFLKNIKEEHVRIKINLTSDINNLSDIEKDILHNEYFTTINNIISKYLFSNSKLINKYDINSYNGSIYTTYDIIRSIFSFFHRYKNNNIITNSLISTLINDLREFNFSNNFSNSLFFNTGTINTNKLYVNSYLNIDFNKLIIFKNKKFFTFTDYKLSYDNKDFGVYMDFNIFINENIKNHIHLYEFQDITNLY